MFKQGQYLNKLTRYVQSLDPFSIFRKKQMQQEPSERRLLKVPSRIGNRITKNTLALFSLALNIKFNYYLKVCNCNLHINNYFCK